MTVGACSSARSGPDGDVGRVAHDDVGATRRLADGLLEQLPVRLRAPSLVLRVSLRVFVLVADLLFGHPVAPFEEGALGAGVGERGERADPYPASPERDERPAQRRPRDRAPPRAVRLMMYATTRGPPRERAAREQLQPAERTAPQRGGSHARATTRRAEPRGGGRDPFGCEEAGLRSAGRDRRDAGRGDDRPDRPRPGERVVERNSPRGARSPARGPARSCQPVHRVAPGGPSRHPRAAPRS